MKSSTKKKVIWRIKKCLFLLGNLLRLSGAHKVAEDPSGIAKVKLNTKSKLGNRGECFFIPIDDVIYKQVILSGAWESKVSTFFSQTMNHLGNKTSVGFIDIGAHVGLITSQILNNLSFATSCFLVEPLRTHVDALELNLEKYKLSENKIHIFPFALGETEKSSSLNKSDSNSGGASLFDLSSRYERDSIFEHKIEIKNASAFFAQLPTLEHYLLKCDAEGSDAYLIGRLPINLIDRMVAMVVEISAREYLDHKVVNDAIAVLERFEFRSWDPTHKESNLSLSEIKEFWLSKSQREANLYLKKTVGKL